jgi:hypothetical protein
VLCAASQEESLREISVLVCSQAERSHDQKRAVTETREQKVVLLTPIVTRADFCKEGTASVRRVLLRRRLQLEEESRCACVVISADEQRAYLCLRSCPL